MKCRKCGHELAGKEKYCMFCGQEVDAQEMSEKNVCETSSVETMDDESGTEYKAISNIHGFFVFLTILAFIGSFVIGSLLEDVWITIGIILSIIIFYCFFRLLIAIAYLLCDIKENTTPRK